MVKRKKIIDAPRSHAALRKRADAVQRNFAFLVPAENAGSRLDQYLKSNLAPFSRSQIQKWIKSGAVLCGGQTSSPSHIIGAGEKIAVSMPEEQFNAAPEAMALNILYEDSSMLVIDKPPGLVTHPAVGQYHGTVANAVAYHLQSAQRNSRMAGLRPGIVHRLDKETSGVLLIAKSLQALEKLSRQFRERSVIKIYRAIVCGKMEMKRGEIEAPIGQEFPSRKMAVISTGRFSRTDFKVLKTFPHYSYVEVFPKTGRTHQIRVHLAKIGFPVLGDSVYGEKTDIAPRLMLHAYQIEIEHPAKKKRVKFRAPLPEDFLKTLKLIS